MQDVRKYLNDFTSGVAGLSESNPEVLGAFMGLQDAAFKDGAISVKTKELISVAIGVYNRCPYCIVVHVYNAYKAGATREEILEAGLTAMSGFGGGPSLAYSATLLQDAVNEFEKDFK